jgi:SagB-type dehydrogenase family enzyme
MATDQQQASVDLTQQSLQLHAGVRLRPPSADDGLWQLHHLTAHTVHAVSASTAWLCLAFTGTASVEQVVDEAAEAGTAAGATLDAIAELRDMQVLVPDSEGLLSDTTAGTHRWAASIMARWSAAGWSAAADYHIATFDYPAVSYADGATADAEMMREFLADERDDNRTKKYPDIGASYECGSAREALDRLDRPFDEVWEECCGRPRALTATRVEKHHLETLCAAVFGQLRSRPMRPRERRKPLAHKISPSGGGRHPTECYLVSLDVDDLPRGVYHFSAETDTLDRIGELPSDAETESIFDGLFRARHERSFEPRALVILTSVFERNMFRYREPRTFRTVFMDVGCAITNLELIARAMGYSMYTHNAMSDTRTEALLGIHGLNEGLNYGAAIGVYEQ